MSDDELDISAVLRLIECDNSLERKPINVAGLREMVFESKLADHGATEPEIKAIAICPEQLEQFWKRTRWARLFEDKTYGQWGLEILEPDAARRATESFLLSRPKDYKIGDLIVGRFLGDSQLLLIRCDPRSPDFGTIIVVEPIYNRHDWDWVGKSFQEFLVRYIRNQGEMYWVPRKKIR